MKIEVYTDFNLLVEDYRTKVVIDPNIIWNTWNENAADITYDNSYSTLSATNVKSALDELDSEKADASTVAIADMSQDDETQPDAVKNKNRHTDITASGDLLQTHNDAILRFTDAHTANLTALLEVDFSVNIKVGGNFTPTIAANGLTLEDSDGAIQTTITLEPYGYYHLHNYGDKFVLQ